MPVKKKIVVNQEGLLINQTFSAKSGQVEKLGLCFLIRNTGVSRLKYSVQVFVEE